MDSSRRIRLRSRQTRSPHGSGCSSRRRRRSRSMSSVGAARRRRRGERELGWLTRPIYINHSGTDQAPRYGNYLSVWRSRRTANGRCSSTWHRPSVRGDVRAWLHPDAGLVRATPGPQGGEREPARSRPTSQRGSPAMARSGTPALSRPQRGCIGWSPPSDPTRSRTGWRSMGLACRRCR
jgi:hypothetical protein